MTRFKPTDVIVFLIVTMILWASPAFAYERYKAVVKFDPYFKKYTKRFFGPGFDWQHFKAQAVAESRLKARIRSRVGAVGVMQIMPRTFKEIMRKNPAIKGSRAQPRWNIAAGIYYDRLIWKVWQADRPFQDRLNFTFGAYNAGKATIIKAQRLAKSRGMNPNRWQSIEVVLPDVTGRHSRETIGYVRKITTIKEALK